MSERPPSPEIRRTDPALGARQGAGDVGSIGATGLARVLLAPISVPLFLLARVRLLRRRRGWQIVRLVLLAGAVLTASVVPGWWKVLAAFPAVLGALLRQTRDPDGERRIQRIHRAEYLLNGGEWRKAEDGRPAAAAYLLLRDVHLMVVPRARESDVEAAVSVDAIAAIRVDGVPYRPVYVSEAKQPPVREKQVDRHAVAELVLDLRTGGSWRFRYRGAFAKHLAETAAHAIYSVRAASGTPTGISR